MVVAPEPEPEEPEEPHFGGVLRSSLRGQIGVPGLVGPRAEVDARVQTTWQKCLPRLIDALLTDTPPYTFPVSCAGFISEERRAAEVELGVNPSTLRRRDYVLARPKPSPPLVTPRTACESASHSSGGIRTRRARLTTCGGIQAT